MARDLLSPSGGSGDGSAPAHGEIISQAGSRPPRTARTGDQVAGLTVDPTSSPEMNLHNAAARAALQAHNSGASDSDSGGSQ